MIGDKVVFFLHCNVLLHRIVVDLIDVVTYRFAVELVLEKIFVQQSRMRFGYVEMSLLVVQNIVVPYPAPGKKFVESAFDGMCQPFVIVAEFNGNGAVCNASV